MIDSKAEVCCGCKLCSSLCPTSAITIELDDTKLNFHPVVDHAKCVNCGLCVKNCPFLCRNNFNQVNENDQKCYAATSLNKEAAFNAASGGIASALAINALANGYSVFQSRFLGGDLSTNETKTQFDIDLAKGSKYVYSDPSNSYDEVAKKLNAGQNVLFIGTPCQSYAARRYCSLKARDGASKLVTVDLICHGTPTPYLLKQYLFEKTKVKNFDNIIFRSEEGWRLAAYSNGRKIFSEEWILDPYCYSFISGYIFQNGCYQCPFANRNRQSDVTIGDFWGLPENEQKEFGKRRVSVLIANTSKGNEVLNSLISNSAKLKIESVDVAVNGNDNLRYPSPENEYRKVFQKEFSSKGFNKSFKKTKGPVVIAKRKIRKALSRAIKKILRRA